MNSLSASSSFGRLLFALLLAAGLHLVVFDLLPSQQSTPALSGNSLELTLIRDLPSAAKSSVPGATAPSAVTPETDSSGPSVPKPTQSAPLPTETRSEPPKPSASQIQPAPIAPITAAKKPTNTAAVPKPKPVSTPEPPEANTSKTPQSVTEPQRISEQTKLNPTPKQAISKASESKPASADNQQPSAPVLSGTSLLARSLTMARAIPEPGWDNRSDAPRVRRLSGDSRRHSHHENSYLMQWRQKVQRIGQLNYPESARREKLSGQLRMLVVLQSDGSLDYSEVLTSSGYPALDEAALRIIDLAAPFQPFPVELRKTTDRLEIIRVWRFENNTVVY